MHTPDILRPRRSIDSQPTRRIRSRARMSVGGLNPGISLTLYSMGALVLVAAVHLGITAIMDRSTKAWAAAVADKIDNPQDLDPKLETFYPRVKVVGAGVTYAERRLMERLGEQVNVRSFPRSTAPKVGTVAVGSRIEQVVYLREIDWGLVRCADIEGLKPSIPEDTQPLICAIHGHYLLSDSTENPAKELPASK